MSAQRRARLVALDSLLRKRNIDNPEFLISRARVMVDGTPATNPNSRVRSDATIRIAAPPRGARKLAPQLTSVAIEGLIALDLGASTGGFTEALLDAGAAQVYAVDAGHGQLLGWLRADSRVHNLERTNLASLDSRLVPEPVDIITMDLSYLPVADAIGQLDRRLLAPDAELLALVKPTFELRSGTLAAAPDDVSKAVDLAERALTENDWQVLGRRPSTIRGSHGAVEAFVRARALPLSRKSDGCAPRTSPHAGFARE